MYRVNYDGQWCIVSNISVEILSPSNLSFHTRITPMAPPPGYDSFRFPFSLLPLFDFWEIWYKQDKSLDIVRLLTYRDFWIPNNIFFFLFYIFSETKRSSVLWRIWQIYEYSFLYYDLESELNEHLFWFLKKIKSKKIKIKRLTTWRLFSFIITEAKKAALLFILFFIGSVS